MNEVVGQNIALKGAFARLVGTKTTFGAELKATYGAKSKGEQIREHMGKGVRIFPRTKCGL